jgi:hypothetical protein
VFATASKGTAGLRLDPVFRLAVIASIWYLVALTLAGCSSLAGSGPKVSFQAVPGTTPGPASWRIVGPVTPDTTSIDLMIEEGACASDTSPAGRVLDPIVGYDAKTITITVQVMPLAGVQTCPGNPEYPLTVHLTEPVGEREIAGGSLPFVPGPGPTPAASLR